MFLEHSVNPVNKAIRSKKYVRLTQMLSLNTIYNIDDYSLAEAIKTRDKEPVQIVLNFGAKPNEETLALAIRSNNQEIVGIVMDAGAKPDSKGIALKASLHCANENIHAMLTKAFPDTFNEGNESDDDAFSRNLYASRTRSDLSKPISAPVLSSTVDEAIPETDETAQPRRITK